MESINANHADIPVEKIFEFTRRVFPDETSLWNKTETRVTAYIGTTSKAQDAFQVLEMLIEDTNHSQDKRIKRNVDWVGHDLSIDANDSGLHNATIRTTATRVLHIAGRTAACLHHSKCLLPHWQENVINLRQHHYLERTHPWLNRIFDPTIMRCINEWYNWVCQCFAWIKPADSTLSAPSNKLAEKVQLGARFHVLWRALDFSDETQDQMAKDFARYNADLVLQEEPSFLECILGAVKDLRAKQYPALSKLSVSMIRSIAKKALTEGILIADESQDAQEHK